MRNQLYVGVVEDDNDHLHLGRVKVRVTGLHTHNRYELPTEDLPWAVSAIEYTPSIYSTVAVMFADWPDCQMPVVLGTFPVITQEEDVTINGFEVTPLYADSITPAGRTIPRTIEELGGGSTIAEIDATIAKSMQGRATVSRSVTAACKMPSPWYSAGNTSSLADYVSGAVGVSTPTGPNDATKLANLELTAGSGTSLSGIVGAAGGTQKVYDNRDKLLEQFKDGPKQQAPLGATTGASGATGPVPNTWWKTWRENIFALPANPPKVGDKYKGSTKKFEIPAPPIPGFQFCPINVPTFPELPKIKITSPDFKPPKFKLPSLDEILEHFGLNDLPCIPVPFMGAFTDPEDQKAFKKYKDKVKEVWSNPSEVAKYVMDYEYNIAKDALDYNEGEVSKLIKIENYNSLTADSFKNEGKTPPIKGVYGGPNYVGAVAEWAHHSLVNSSDTPRGDGKKELANTAPPDPQAGWSAADIWRGEKVTALTDAQIAAMNAPLYENGKPVNPAAQQLEAAKKTQ